MPGRVFEHVERAVAQRVVVNSRDVQFNLLNSTTACDMALYLKAKSPLS